MDKQALISAMEIASMSLDKGTFNYFIFKEGTVTCFDSQSVTIAVCPEGIDAAVSANLLDFLRKAKGDDVTVKKDGTNILFKVGKSKASMATTDGYDVPPVPNIDIAPLLEDPDVPEEADAMLNSMDIFVKGLIWCADVTDKKAQTTKMSHVMLSGDVGATDNYRIRYLKGAGLFPDVQYLAPGDALKNLSKLSEVHNITITDGWLCFFDAYDTRYYVRLGQDNDYPNLPDMLVPDGDALTFPEEVFATLDLMNVFIDSTSIADQEALLTVMPNGRGTLHREASYGTFDEDFKMTKPSEKLEFLVNPVHLGEALKLSRTGYFSEGRAIFLGQGDDKMKTALIRLG